MTQQNGAKILNESIELYQDSANGKNISIEFNPSNQNLEVYVDKIRISEVIENLLSNAIKYTPSGGSVNISLAEAGKDIRFKVVDNGMGISPEDLDRIFERFYRIKTKQTRSITGSGLGLSIVKGIVDAHNGTVHVESKVGKGTTFIVSLPTQE